MQESQGPLDSVDQVHLVRVSGDAFANQQDFVERAPGRHPEAELLDAAFDHGPVFSLAWFVVHAVEGVGAEVVVDEQGVFGLVAGKGVAHVLAPCEEGGIAEGDEQGFDVGKAVFFGLAGFGVGVIGADTEA